MPRANDEIAKSVNFRGREYKAGDTALPEHVSRLTALGYIEGTTPAKPVTAPKRRASTEK